MTLLGQDGVGMVTPCAVDVVVVVEVEDAVVVPVGLVAEVKVVSVDERTSELDIVEVVEKEPWVVELPPGPLNPEAKK